MTLFVKDKTVMDALTGTQVGIFPTKAQAEIFVRSMVGCEEAGIDFKACEKIANKIALLEETHIPLSDGSWA